MNQRTRTLLAWPGNKTRFVLTTDDSPFNRELFKRCQIKPVVTKNKRVNQRTCAGATFGELIITP